jgi:hypothetical protein
MTKQTKTLDTIAVIEYDSTMLPSNNLKQVILVKEYQNKKDEDWYETSFLTSFIFPALAALIVLFITKRINRNKDRIESEKLEEEVDKIKIETENIKKSFQPIVIGTLQSVQEKIIDSKIDALKSLVELKNKFAHHEQQYCEGDPIIPEYSDFIELLFFEFSVEKFQKFKEFHNNYSYLFPDNVLNKLQELFMSLSALNEDKKSFESWQDYDADPSKEGVNHIENIIKLFDDSIMLMRKDCHLDTSFIHEFIEKNK